VRWRLKTGLDRIRAELDRGDARNWRALLLPLLPSRSTTTTTLLQGVALMSMKKIAAGLVLLVVLLVALFAVRPSRQRDDGAAGASAHHLRATLGPRGLPVAATGEPTRRACCACRGR
jgi:hypothetical protein